MPVAENQLKAIHPCNDSEPAMLGNKGDFAWRGITILRHIASHNFLPPIRTLMSDYIRNILYIRYYSYVSYAS